MTTVTPTVPQSGQISFSLVKNAFPGLSAPNQMKTYYGRAAYMSSDPTKQSISMSSFRGVTAPTPSFGTLSNAPAPPNLAGQGFASPISGVNAVVNAGGLVSGMVGGNDNYVATTTFSLINYLDNNAFHVGTGQCAFSVLSGTLPAGVTLSSASNGTLTVAASTASSQDQTVVFKCTNFYGNYSTATIKFNLNPAMYYGGALAIYTGESFCPATGIWADITGSGRHATSGGGSIALSNINSRTTLTGSTASTMTWPSGVLPSTYTLFHVAKYNGANKGRILTSSDGANWLSGHVEGNSGVAYHSAWLTNTTDYGGGANWILSSDQNSLYRVNGIAQAGGGGGAVTSCRLGINTYAAETSHWAVALVAVYPSTLNQIQLANVEQALATQYGCAYLSGTAGTTLDNGTYVLDLATVLKNCTSYAVVSNPNNYTTFSGSTSTTTGASRNTSYTVKVAGYAPNGSVSICSIAMVENQETPSVNGYPNQTTANPTGNNDYYAGGNFTPGNGSSQTWSVTSTHPNYSALASGGIRIAANYRYATYSVTVTLTTYRYDGTNAKSTNTTFSVTELRCVNIEGKYWDNYWNVVVNVTCNVVTGSCFATSPNWYTNVPFSATSSTTFSVPSWPATMTYDSVTRDLVFPGNNRWIRQ